MRPWSVPTAENLPATANVGFITSWDILSASKDVQLFGRLHSEPFNVTLFILPDVRLQFRLTKARPSFYMVNKATDSKTTFEFLDAQLLVRRIRTNPVMFLAHNSTLSKGVSRGET